MTVKKWRAATAKEKRNLAVVLQQEARQVNELSMGYARPSEEVLQTHYKRVQKSLPKYRNFLDRIGKEAEVRGLTEEILEEILKDA